MLQHCEHIFVYADMQNVCRCMQMCAVSAPLELVLNFLKLSVNLNLQTAGLPTPEIDNTKHLRFVYTERKRMRKPIYLFDFYCCSM